MPPELHDIAVEFAQFKTEVRSDIDRLVEALEKLDRNYEAFTRLQNEQTTQRVMLDNHAKELVAVWLRIDSQRKKTEDLERSEHEMKGATTFARWLFGSIAVGLISATGYLFNAVSDLKVISEKLRVIEQYHAQGGK